jgi:hypothetical protein
MSTYEKARSLIFYLQSLSGATIYLDKIHLKIFKQIIKHQAENKVQPASKETLCQENNY